MKKYNNIANHVNFAIGLMNVVAPVMIVFFAMKSPSIDTIIPMILFICMIVTGDFMYFYLLDHWYLTYYDEHKIVQKWFKKEKKIDFEEVKYLYFIGTMVIVSAHDFKINAKNDVSFKERRRLLRILKNELCISINVYDKAFPKILLRKCFKAVKINLGVKEKICKEMFELN